MATRSAGALAGETGPRILKRQDNDDHEEEEEEEEESALGSFFSDERHQAPPFLLRPFNEDRRHHPPTVVPLKQDSRDALGGRVWRASVFLLRWLERRSPSLAGQVILDVGAGIGVLGLACALAEPAPRLVVVTDQACMLELLGHNTDKVKAVISARHELRLNPLVPTPCRLAACRLDWLQPGRGEDVAALRRELDAAAAAAGGEKGGGGFDWILVADCVYYAHLYAPLVDTLASLAGEGTRVVICNDDGRTLARQVEAATGERWDAGFFSLLRDKFDLEEDVMHHVGEEFQGDLGMEGGGPYRVVVCRRRREAASLPRSSG